MNAHGQVQTPQAESKAPTTRTKRGPVKIARPLEVPRPLETLNPIEILGAVAREAISHLDRRTGAIVARRVGLDGAVPVSLIHIAREQGISRERIRQIERDGQSRMARAIGPERLGILVEAAMPALWDKLAAGPILTRRMLKDRRHAIDPAARLALRIAGVDLEKAMASLALVFPNGWHRRDAEAAAVGEAALDLAKRIRTTLLPRALASLAPGHEPAIAEKAVRLAFGNPVVQGYVAPVGRDKRPDAPANIQDRRRIALHAILGSAPARAMTLDDLTAAHAAGGGNGDRHPGRDAKIEIDRAPHMFLRLTEDAYAALGDAGRPGRRDEAPDRGPVDRAGTKTPRIRSPWRSRPCYRPGDTSKSQRWRARQRSCLVRAMRNRA